MALPAVERAHWLNALDRAFEDLKPALQQVLERLPEAQASEFLRAPNLPDEPMDGPNAALHAGQQIGPYQLLHELGRGGMGEVWLARRVDGAYERDVALKLPHAHLMSGSVRERFIRERNILASLSHPNIARFYDAGLSAQGQPYLALEAVQGEPISRWAANQRLGLRARLTLFAQVTAAVAYAHTKLIAHRDLKPANVLVTQDGEVRLLDFGIAKLLQDGDAEQDAMTRADARLATPEYAAPEQLTGGAVTVATDVYALAAMLFELLTGRPPFKVNTGGSRLQLGEQTPTRADPPLASQQVDERFVSAIGELPSRWHRALSGDIDAILCKALQPHAENRYASVLAFAADLSRHLSSQPIEARRITAMARAAKFWRRHRVGLSLLTLLGASVVVGVSGVLWQAHQAQLQARRAEAVKEFLLGVFQASDPRLASDTPRGQITAKALLDASASRIEARFADDPELQIELLRTVADIYRELDEDQAYDRLQTRQLEISRQHFGPLHDNVLGGQLEAAERASDHADYASCRAMLTEADASIRQAGRDHSALRGHWWLTHSICLRDLPNTERERQTALQAGLQVFERYAPADRGHVTALSEIATEASHQNRYDDAIRINRQAIALALQQAGRNDAELQTLYGNLALALQQIGDLDQAEVAYGQSAEIARRTSGSTGRTAWMPTGKHARTSHLGGHRERAVALFENVIALLPPNETHDPDAQNVREDFGERLAAEGRPLLAIPILEAVERSWLAKPPQDFVLRRVRRHLGDAYDRAGRHQDARRTLRLALADFEAHAPKGSQPMIAMRERWGRFLLDRGELDAAKAQLERAVNQAEIPTWSHVALAQAGLARVALAHSDSKLAAQRSAQALATWSRLTGFRDVRMQPYLWRVQAATQAAAGDAAGAHALRDRALAASRQYDAPESPTARDPQYVGL